MSSTPTLPATLTMTRGKRKEPGRARTSTEVEDLAELADLGEGEAPAAEEPTPPAVPSRPPAKPSVPFAGTTRPDQQHLDALTLGLVEVRDTQSAKGMGLYARQELPDNTYVGDYVGEVLSEEQYLRRYPNEDAE